MVYHKASNRAICHHCSIRMVVPQRCDRCGKTMNKFGLGTQRAEEELERLKVEAKELEEKAAEKEKDLEADVKESAEELKRLEEEHEKAFRALQPEHAQIYARLYRRDGLAVVPVVNGACQGCFMHVPSEIVSKLLADSGQLVLCRSCGRILYLEQEEGTR